jgi:hypothetical protein
LLKSNFKQKINLIIFIIIFFILIDYFDLWFILDSFGTQKVHCSDNHLSTEELINKYEASLKKAESKKFLIRLITVACCIVIMIVIHKDDFK